MFDSPRSFLFCKDLWGREKSNWLLRKKISHPGFCQGGRFVICREKVFSCLFCFVDMLKPIVTAQCLTGRTASSAGTQCLSRLRRAHSAFSRLRRAHSASRAYGGHTVPLAPTAGTQCLSRLRRAHSASRAYGGHTVPRAYGGHTVPLAPTAGTKCLSRLRRAHSAFRAYGVP